MIRDKLKQENIYREKIEWNKEAITEFKEFFEIEENISEKK